MRAFVFLCLLSFAGAAVLRSGEEIESATNPIRKVVGLLQNMQKEIEEEGAKEKQLFDNFMCFCDNGRADLEKTSADASAQNKAAASKLEADTSEKGGLEQDIKQHQADFAAATKDLEAASNVRDQSKAEFDEEHSTKSASADALGRAIPAIEKGMGGGSLLQFAGAEVVKGVKRALHSSQQLTNGDRKEVLAFLAGSQPGSSEILGMLKAMKDELSRDLGGLEQSEAASTKSFAGMKAPKQKEIEFADESIEAKKERVGTLAVEIVQGKDEVEDSAKEAEEASTFASTLTQQCATKKTEWADRSKMRADELAALGEVTAMLSDDDALDVFKKSLPAALMQDHVNRFTGQLSFLQARKPAMLLQKAQAILGSLKVDSSVSVQLFTLRTRMRVAQGASLKGAVDFGEITKMIDEMVTILSNEHTDDKNHRTFCISELEKTDREKAGAQDKMTSLTSTVEQINDNVANSAQTIADLQAGIQGLDKDVAEATEQRKQEHSDYLVNLQLSETAIQLMSKAKNRLQKFYNPSLYKAAPKKEITMEEKIIASGSSALMQSEAAFDNTDEDTVSLLQLSGKVALPEAPETFGLFQKNKKSGGVMALIDMLVNDLKASLQEAQMAEKQAQKDYVELMQESQASRQQDGKSAINEQSTKAQLEGALSEAKESQHLTLAQLENLHSTIARLHGSCDFLLKNFEVRAGARTSEIEGLKNAKAVLAGANFA